MRFSRRPGDSSAAAVIQVRNSRRTRDRSRRCCWIDSGAYTTILGGDYPRRADDDTASVSAAAQEAAASYTATFERTQDTLGRLVHDLAGWMGTASTWINDRFRRGPESA